jgi:hypothetical protein
MRRIFLLTFYFIYCISGQSQSSAPIAKRGVLDLTSWDFNEKKIALNGYWNFYANELIDPTDISKKSGSTSLFPEVWANNIQYGTYQLNIITTPGARKLAVTIPQLYCSYEFWINGEKIAENGVVGISKETTTPVWMPQTVSFENENDTLSVLIKISNFYHSKGGAKEPIYLGSSEILMKQRSVATLSNVLQFIILTLLGLSIFVVYYVREEKKKITFYFSLLCLSWAIRCVFSNLYIVTSYIPNLNWSLMVKVEYIMLYSSMIWAILFLGRLFPNESNKIIKYFLVGLNCVFIVVTAVAPPAFFTQWLHIYLSVAGILLLFSAVIVIKALINERTGVWFLVASIFLSLVLFGYDIFVYEGFSYDYNSVLFSFGYITIFMMLTIALLYHLKIFKGESSLSSLTYEDLYGKKDDFN